MFSRVTDILNFWFAGLNDQGPLDKKDVRVKRWFVKDRAFDEEIRQKFEADLLRAARGELKDWEETAHGRLALIILLDQFSRNLYRNSAAMYATDAPALALTRRTIDEGKDKDLSLVERIFLYMPLMHAEDRAVQALSVKCFGELVQESQTQSPQNTPYFEYTLLYAQKHRDIVERFGRFPHRNSLLKRTSTEQEQKFLSQPNASF